jgi:hypothetical protein
MRPIIKRLVSCLVLSILAFNAGGQNAGPEPLEPNRDLERRLVKDEKHRYRIAVRKGDFVRVTALQRNVDLALAATAPDGAALLASNNFEERGDREKISLVAEADGEYLFEVSFVADLSGRTAGESYVLRLEALRPPTEKDRAQIDAEKLYEQAIAAGAENKAESRRASV